ncbi:hypothetical protein LEP1GSC193_1586 [Leptospira alstonii serovar Pingchang str. 80-412]|uniref:Uncharacterized protein n=1 Tax=Leptospira alstonii serovar Pingchang str. 80-412 TaxID=1218564 RepID=T0GZE1_9LEPT|nr:hypothetical protein LEP1GSC193_1586 [Leptospira alstonii serovar Pingchang str. 80-412]
MGQGEYAKLNSIVFLSRFAERSNKEEILVGPGIDLRSVLSFPKKRKPILVIHYSELAGWNSDKFKVCPKRPIRTTLRKRN